uniref:NADH dehydrogenase [ubiquinone] 1 alpha subcomplex subunit 9, mitochondrial n=1 Tax=Globodera rostochiensis TaxID=31243 RepID=A0A914GYX8_GLORO
MITRFSQSLPEYFLRNGNFCSIRARLQYSSAENVPENVPEPLISSSNVAQFRKGPGGRSSFSGNVVTVFGSTGFTGLRVVNRLAKHGNQLILPYRCDAYFVKELKVMCDLGQVLFFPFQLNDDESIRKAVKHSNIVINLIGTYIDTVNYSIYDTNVEGAGKIARICREMGVERLVHVSAMNADPSYKTRFIKNGAFLKSKGMGEQAVLAEFPNATIIRPSVLYGEFDRFIYPMLTRWRKNPLDMVYAFNLGNGIYKMPLFVNDFSNGVAKAAMDPTAVGKTYEFVGPHCYEMCELLDFICLKGGLSREYSFYYRRIGIREPWFLFISFLCYTFTKLYRRPGFINWEWFDFVEATSDVLTGGGTRTLKDLGITNLAEFEEAGGRHCMQMSFLKPYELDYDDYPHPPLPLRSPPLYKQKQTAFDVRDVLTEQRAFGL